MRDNDLTRREFVGASSAFVLGAYSASFAGPEERGFPSKPEVKKDFWERLKNVSVYVYPINGTSKIRVFEISNEFGGISRFTDADRETGRETREYSSAFGSPYEFKFDHELIGAILVSECKAYESVLKRAN